MVVADLINGTYETMGGILLFLNCIRLYKDKEVKGISIFTTAFFASWGFWNLVYYPHLHQWLSFYGGILVVTANTTWVAMAFYYKRKSKREAMLKM